MSGSVDPFRQATDDPRAGRSNLRTQLACNS